MDIKIINNLDELVKLEELRYDVLEIDVDVDRDSNFYINNFSNKKMIALGLYRDNKVVAGIYVSFSLGRLYVDYLFVDKKYQNSGLRLGRQLLQYVLDNKEIFVNYFNSDFSYCYLEPKDDRAVNVVSKLGFKDTKNIMGEYKRRI